MVILNVCIYQCILIFILTDVSTDDQAAVSSSDLHSYAICSILIPSNVGYYNGKSYKQLSLYI